MDYYFKINQKKISLIFLPIILFFLTHLWRPWFLGLYHDDWNLFIDSDYNKLDVLEFFEDKLIGDRPRPIHDLIIFIIKYLVQDNIFFLIFISSIIVGISSISIFFFLKKILFVLDLDDLHLPFIISFWLIIPWSLGYTLWISGITTLFSMIFFNLSIVYLLNFLLKNRLENLFLSLFFLLISFLTYQAFYFYFIPILLLIIVLNKKCSLNKRNLSLSIISFFTIQFLAIFYTYEYTPKNISLDIVLIIANIIFFLPMSVLNSFGSMKIFFLITLCIFIYANFIFLKNYYANRKNKFLLILVIIFLGVFFSTVSYSIAGYQIKGIGIFSRTTLVFNHFLVTMLSIYFAKVLSENKMILHKKYKNILCIFLLMLFASGSQFYGWNKSWERQSEILSSFPINKIKKLKKNTVLILNEPLTNDYGITVFGAPWDITSAVYSLRGLRSILPKDRIKIVPFYKNSLMYWDGKNLEINSGWLMKAKSILVYTPGTNYFKKIGEYGKISNIFNNKSNLEIY